MRQNNRLREGEVVNEIMRELMASQLTRSWMTIREAPYSNYAELMEEPDKAKREAFTQTLENVIGTFEGCGVLVARGVASIEVIDYYAHGFIREIWLKLKPIIEGYRVETKHYEYAEWLEFLYQRIYGGLSNSQALAQVMARRKSREGVAVSGFPSR